MSTSVARLTANAANAQHSTGPRTLEGQARSSQNARTHGLTAGDLIVLPAERQEFEQFLNDYQAAVKPQDAIQQSLFAELVEAAWNLRRIRRMDAALCANATSYQDLVNDDGLQKKLDRLSRHKTRIQRTLHRTLNELRALQTNTVIEATLPRSVRLQVAPLANATEISKRTHQFEKTGQLKLLRTLLEAPPPFSVPEKFRAAGLTNGDRPI